MSALAEALVAAQAELPCALGKDAEGQIQSRTYRYLTLDKLIAATKPILQKHGLTIMQSPSFAERGEDGALPTLTTTLIHVGADAFYRVVEYLRAPTPLITESEAAEIADAALFRAKKVIDRVR